MYIELHVATLTLIGIGCIVASAIITFYVMVVALRGAAPNTNKNVPEDWVDY